MKFRRIARLWAAVLLLALLLASALAEDKPQYYAGFFDYYYHAHPKCAVAGTVAPIDRDEAEAQGKYPCPVCVDDDTKYKGVAATVRGGTLVIRVPDQWMLDRPANEMEDNIDFFSDEQYTDRAARAVLAEQLHGADYRGFLTALEADGEAKTGGETPLYHPTVPSIKPGDGALLMHRRHIGGAWYLVYRPEESARKQLNKKGKIDVDLYFTVNSMRMTGDTLRVYSGGLWENLGEPTALKPKKSKNKAEFEDEWEYKPEGYFLDWTVYRDMETNICVLHRFPSATAPLAEAALLIDGADSGIRLTGYDDGENTGVFCCVLTDAEVDALKNGARFEMIDGGD